MALRREQEYCSTYEDWLKIENDTSVRVELIDGKIYMFASPTWRHQAVLGEIYGQLYNHLRGKRCKVSLGPIDVRLEKDTVVVPDVIVICDPNKITNAGVNGAPDLIVEVLSPSTSRHDKLVKFALYQRTGVSEYWIVDPLDNTITAYRLVGNEYVASAYGETDSATVAAIPGFEMDLAQVFTEDVEVYTEV